MIRIEIPANNHTLAALIGVALTQYAQSRGVGALQAHDETVLTLSAGAPATQAPPAAETDGDSDNSGAPAQNVDQKGVPFHADYCANAKEPFYSSGPTLGQWKKARGVNQDAYDKWYAEELAKAKAAWTDKASVLGIQTPAASEPPEPSAAAAFGQQTPPPAANTAPAPTTGGELMTWVSERQVAGRLTQTDIDEAWRVTGFAVTDLFGPNAAAAVASVHGILAPKAGA